MATSGSFTGSIRNGWYSIRVDWSAEQNVVNNTSKVTCKLYFINTQSLSISSRTHTLVIDGISYNLSSKAINTIGTHEIGSCVKTINHNSDGSKSISISCTFNIKATLSGTFYSTITANKIIELDTIPRATIPTTGEIADIGTTIIIDLPRAHTSFTHTLKYQFENINEIIGTSLVTSASWNIPVLLMNQLQNSTSGICAITCETYNGSTKIGEKTINITLTVPENIIPSIDFTIEEVGSDVAKEMGIYIQNVSKLLIKTNGIGIYDSTIKTYKIEVGSTVYNSNEIETNILTNSDELKIKASCTDSRGRTATLEKTINIIHYEKPKIENFIVERSSSYNVDITIKCNIANIKGNIPTYLIEYKKKSDESFNDNYILSDTTTSIDKIISLANIDVDYGYNFKFTVRDLFNEIFITYDIGTEFTLIDFHKDGTGIAFGKVAETPNKIEFALPVEFTIQAIADMVYPVGSIYMSMNNTNPELLFGGTWEQIKDKFLLGAGDSYDGGTTGGESTHKLTIDEMPSHTHIQNPHSHSTRYKGFSMTPSQSTSYYHVLRRNDESDSYDGTDEDGAISTTAINKETGGGEAHNNMPPYLAVYVWKRVS